jgi:hypothetical protein
MATKEMSQDGIGVNKEQTMEAMELWKVRLQMESNVLYWSQRNIKFKEWFEILWLVDQLSSKGMETYVSNEPATFYNMAHFLLTRGELSHVGSIETETALELDRRAKINRACQYMWSKMDRDRQLGGDAPFIDELGFYLLVLGWYSVAMMFDSNTGLIQAKIWNPADVYPQYANNRMVSCLHRYKVLESEAVIKAQENRWEYKSTSTPTGTVTIDDYFLMDANSPLKNIIIVNGQNVTGWVERPEMKLLVAPVAGFPDRGSLTPSSKDWRQLIGRGIFEVNDGVTTAINKWKSIISQILRDTAQPITQEFSSTPQASPEQLRERGALFHYAPGEAGLQRVSAPSIPIELQAHLMEMDKEKQKGSFNDTVYGMVEGQAGYALSILSSSSANQILYPYMDAKHFVVSTADKFWLSNLKTSKRVFEVKGKFAEKLKPTDIPDDVEVIVSSDVATPKDWLERATIGNMLGERLDDATIITEIYRLQDPQSIQRRKSLDKMLNHPVSQLIELISGYETHAQYLELRGDAKQAKLFRKAAKALESQLGGLPAGQPNPLQSTAVEAARATPETQAKPRVAPTVSPPEQQGGFVPAQLRQSLGRGKLSIV